MNGEFSMAPTRDVKYSEGFILDGAFGPLHTGEIERAKAWGAQLVRTSVANPEGWAIWQFRTLVEAY
jgi:hypothetical protein